MDYRQHALDIFDFQILHLQLNTPLFILALILVLMVCIHLLLFRPVLRTLDGRQREFERLGTDTAAQKAELAGLTEQYRRDLERVRGEVETVREQAHADSHKAQGLVLDRARKDADKELQDALTSLRTEVGEARKQLGRTARQLAAQAADRILGA